MSRKPGPDLEKIKKIRKILAENPNGLWIREIARRVGISKSTVHLYLSTHMKSEIEEVLSGSSGFVKIIRLKKV